MSASQSRKFEALMSLARRGGTSAERTLAADKAADMIDRFGLDFFSYFPLGLPE